jgi:hypothetical protein
MVAHKVFFLVHEIATRREISGGKGRAQGDGHGRYRPLNGRELAWAMKFPDTDTWPGKATVAKISGVLGTTVCPQVAQDAAATLTSSVTTRPPNGRTTT